MKKPVHESNVTAEVWYSGTDREIHGQALSDAGGASKIGFGIVTLSAGCNTLPAHFHTEEDEHLYVLEGTATLHLGDETYPLIKGSYVNFPPGQEAPHYISNNSDMPLKYIMVGERLDADQVVHSDPGPG